MTDKEKIIEILKQTSDIWKDEERHGYIVSVDIGEIADALIAANIGDVSEYKKTIRDLNTDVVAYRALSKANTLEQIIEGQKSLIDEYKHRAEVAERALKNALNNDTCYFCNEKNPCRCEHRDWGSDECIKSLLQQAEKELTEEI